MCHFDWGANQLLVFAYFRKSNPLIMVQAIHRFISMCMTWHQWMAMSIGLVLASFTLVLKVKFTCFILILLSDKDFIFICCLFLYVLLFSPQLFGCPSLVMHLVSQLFGFELSTIFRKKLNRDLSGVGEGLRLWGLQIHLSTKGICGSKYWAKVYYNLY